MIKIYQELSHYAKLNTNLVDSEGAACGRYWCSYKCERYRSNLAVYNTHLVMDELSLWVVMPLQHNLFRKRSNRSSTIPHVCISFFYQFLRCNAFFKENDLIIIERKGSISLVVVFNDIWYWTYLFNAM